MAFAKLAVKNARVFTKRAAVVRLKIILRKARAFNKQTALFLRGKIFCRKSRNIGVLTRTYASYGGKRRVAYFVFKLL